jgi:hypothetical protein
MYKNFPEFTEIESQMVIPRGQVTVERNYLTM